MTFAGKVAVITGGSRGIGAAITFWLARDGAAVVVAANEPSVEAVAEAIRGARGRAGIVHRR
jgi:3-oxoacyl-[acyl-carrier protein] reductase